MPKTDEGQSDKSRKKSSPEPGRGEDRMITDEEWEDLLEDAETFKQKHDKTFRILAERDEE